VKDHGLIFGSFSLTAIREGRKFMTRRLLAEGLVSKEFSGHMWWKLAELCNSGQPVLRYKVGDTIYAKEAFVRGYPVDCGEVQQYDEDGNDLPLVTWFRADGDLSSWQEDDDRCVAVRWKSPLFMPRECARYRFTLTEVRIERLQDITEEDAIAEGAVCIDPPNDASVAYFQGFHDPNAPMQDDCGSGWYFARDAYAALWDSMHAKPKPVYRKEGERKVIDYYVSYPWDGEPETREYRGKPWYVYPNCWVVVLGLKEVA
jgi:hypothetical protein